jgi:hypothetical protein
MYYVPEDQRSKRKTRDDDGTDGYPKKRKMSVLKRMKSTLRRPSTDHVHQGRTDGEAKGSVQTSLEKPSTGDVQQVMGTEVGSERPNILKRLERHLTPNFAATNEDVVGMESMRKKQGEGLF